MAIPVEKKDHDYCQILTRVNECKGRQGIQENQGFQRMETKPNNLYETVSDNGNSEIDLYANYSSAYPGKSTPSVRAGILFGYLGSQVCVCFSPFCSYWKSFQKVNQDQCLMLIITPALQDQPWFLGLLKMSVKNLLLLPAFKVLLKDPAGKLNSLLIQNSL